MRRGLVLAGTSLLFILYGAAHGNSGDCLTCLDSTFVRVASPLDAYGVTSGVTPVGKCKVLVVFAMKSNDSSADTCFDWPTTLGDTLPSWAISFIVNDSTPGDFPVPSINDYYFQMSHGRFVVYGEVYPRVVMSNESTVAARVTDVLRQVATDGSFDLSGFDRYRYCSMPDSFETGTDGFVDMIWVLGRREFCAMSRDLPLTQDTLWTDDSTYVNGHRVPLKIHKQRGSQIDPAGHRVYAIPGIAHEFGHSLYDCATTSCFAVCQEDRIGAYGVMEKYWHRGMCMSAYERASMGWMDVDTVSTDTVRLKVPDSVTSGLCFLIPIQHTDTCDNGTAFFLVENRQWSTWYACEPGECDGKAGCHNVDYLPGEGLLVWHVDARGREYDCYKAMEPFHPVDVECAGGVFDCFTGLPNAIHGKDALDSLVTIGIPRKLASPLDLFSSGGSNAFTPYSNPNTNSWQYNENQTPCGWPWATCGKWEQSAPTGISFINIEEGAGDTMLVDIHFNTSPDSIAIDTHWAKWMMLGGDLTVAEGCTLTIDPGAKVSFTPEADSETSGFDTGRIELNVEGSLIAKGEPGHRIRFEPAGRARGHDPQPYDWYGIRLERGSLDTLVRCDIGFGYSGLSIGYGSNEGQLVWPLISKCVIDSNLYSGIDCDHANPTVSECRVEYNGTSEAGGIGIYTCNSSMKVWSDTIRHNLPYNVYMIAGDPDTAHFADISDCTVSGVGASDPNDAYGIVLSRNFWPGSRIARTTVKKCSQQGIGLQYYWGVVEVDSCTISNNCYGIVTDRAVQAPPRPDDTLLVYANTIKNNTTGVLRRKVGGTILLGDSTAAIAGYNSFTGTGTHVCNLMSSTIVAENNWWGSDPPNPFKFVGPVDYAPWLQAAPGQGEASMRSGNSGGILVCSNPSGSMVEFAINAANGGPAVLDVYDVRGKLVKQVTRGDLSPGAHKFAWDGSDSHGATVSKGVYFGRLRLRGEIYTTKVILLN